MADGTAWATSHAGLDEIDVRAGPVTELAVSEDAVWASASGHVVRIDPVTNEVVDRLASRGGLGDIAFDGTGLWAIVGPNEKGEVWQIDPATDAGFRLDHRTRAVTRVRLAEPPVP